MLRVSPFMAVLMCCIFVLWGGGMVAMKIALGSFSVSQVVFARVAMAAVFYLIMAGKWRRLPYRKGDWKYFVALVLFEPCMLFLFETLSMQNTTASQGGMISACFPICTAVGAWLILKEKLSRKILIGLVLAVIGVAGSSLFAPVSESAPNPLLGNLFMACAVLCSTGNAICARYVTSRYSFWAVSAIQAFGGTLFFLPMVCLSSMPSVISWQSVAALAYLGMGVGICAYLGFNFSLQRLPAGIVTMFASLIPVSTLVIARIVLAEELAPMQMFWIAVALCGIVYAASPAKEEMTAD